MSGRRLPTSPTPPGRDCDHLGRVAQLRRAGLAALAVWPAFGALDWFIVEYIEPGRFGFYLALRVLGMFILGLAVALVHARRPPGPRQLVAIETFICASLACLVSVQCLEFRGLASPLALGVVIILLFRSAMLSDHWRRSLAPVLSAALAYPVVLLALTRTSTMMRDQLGDRRVLGVFLLNVGFILAAAAITLIGGHSLWTLRRQIRQNRSLGRYQLKERIGQGGMGEIWSAYHVALRRDVAVKILRPDSSADRQAVARFEREARSTAELSHPNTVRVYDYGVTDDGLWYYAMELLQGEDLSAIIKRGPVPAERAADLIAQASRALAEAHRRGIVHRDVKPANLFLCTIGGDADFVKVLDFGLAKLAENANQSHQSQLTQVGTAVGTPSYVSPEVVMGRPADPRSDVYALGAVLYALVTGHAPFEGGDLRAVLLAHLRDKPVLPSIRLGQPVPRALEALIMRCLDKEPDNRFSSAGDLADALARLHQEEVERPRRHRRIDGHNITAHMPVPKPQPAPAHITRTMSRRLPGVHVIEAPTFLGEAEWADFHSPDPAEDTRS